MAAGAGGSSGSGATASAPTEGLDALIKGPGAATKGTINKAPVEGSFAEVTDQSFQRSGEPKISPTPQQDAVAGLMLSAMLQAAKCDGRIDEAERKKILEALGDASREDIAFVNRELSSPVDVQALVDQVPKGLENQIYAISVLGIDLDSQKEAEYLAALGSALGIGSREANAIRRGSVDRWQRGSWRLGANNVRTKRRATACLGGHPIGGIRPPAAPPGI